MENKTKESRFTADYKLYKFIWKKFTSFGIKIEEMDSKQLFKPLRLMEALLHGFFKTDYKNGRLQMEE